MNIDHLLGCCCKSKTFLFATVQRSLSFNVCLLFFPYKYASLNPLRCLAVQSNFVIGCCAHKQAGRQVTDQTTINNTNANNVVFFLNSNNNNLCARNIWGKENSAYIARSIMCNMRAKDIICRSSPQTNPCCEKKRKKYIYKLFNTITNTMHKMQATAVVPARV